jgi:glycogen debranching enzyme
MHPGSADGHGVWFGDARFLSEYRLLVGGREPRADDVLCEGGWAEFVLRAGDLEIRRHRFVSEGLHERITVLNTGRSLADAKLELVFAADFADMLAVRGVQGLPDPQPAPAIETGRGTSFSDATSSRSTEVILRPAGSPLRLHLGPGEQTTATVHVLPGGAGAEPDFDAGLGQLRQSYRDWAADCAAFETDNAQLNALLQQSRDDMRMLCDRYSTGIYPTAGLPWFAVPFGRDAFFCSLQGLPVNPEIARGALRYLAAHQGRREDPHSEEQPGKILHEVRTGPMVEHGLWPRILYGTVDATPLFLCVLAETLDWTNDIGLYEELLPAAEAALDWCDTYGDPDRDGYIEYGGGRARNQGWKDSHDSLTHVDGVHAPLPAALCEVQAYLYRGLLGMARNGRPQLAARAETLRRRLNRDFWMGPERFVAQGLDGSKRRIAAITSNPGHCLWAGILTPAHARAVATRLMSQDLFSGWGVRTLSTDAVNYDECSYHNGSVWPHDTAIAADGLRKAGFPAAAERTARAILDAGMALPDRRLPELWCGNERTAAALPNSYRNSCSPQNWAAGSVYALVTTLLGLGADAVSGRLRIAPIPTASWQRMEVTGLHFAGSRIDFAVEGERVKVGKLPRGVKVVTSPRNGRGGY